LTGHWTHLDSAPTDLKKPEVSDKNVSSGWRAGG
jgi:hypothetical protein